MVSTAASHARARGSVPGLGGLKETKMFLPHPRVKVSIVGSLRDREVACSASDRQGSNFESCVWRTVSSQSSHHPQEVLLAQFSLYVHQGGLKPDSFHLNFTKPSIFQSLEAVCHGSETQLLVTGKYNIAAQRSNGWALFPLYVDVVNIYGTLGWRSLTAMLKKRQSPRWDKSYSLQPTPLPRVTNKNKKYIKIWL